MKYKILIAFLSGLLFLPSIYAQSVSLLKKIYAYKQAGIPGILPTAANEEGNNQKQSRSSIFNYWIYIETSRNVTITITDLWISGKRFNAKSETIIELPVNKINYSAASGIDTVLLVPYTTYKVLLTYPTGLNKSKSSTLKYFSGLISKNELVVGYIYKGIKYCKALKKMTTLEPEVHQ